MTPDDNLALEDEYPRTRLTWLVGFTALLLFLQGLSAATIAYLLWPFNLPLEFYEFTTLLRTLAAPVAFCLLGGLALSAVVLILRLKPGGWTIALSAQVCALSIGLWHYWRTPDAFDTVVLASSLFVLILLHSTDFQRMFREKLESV